VQEFEIFTSEFKALNFCDKAKNMLKNFVWVQTK